MNLSDDLKGVKYVFAKRNCETEDENHVNVLSFVALQSWCCLTDLFLVLGQEREVFIDVSVAIREKYF